MKSNIESLVWQMEDYLLKKRRYEAKGVSELVEMHLEKVHFHLTQNLQELSMEEFLEVVGHITTSLKYIEQGVIAYRDHENCVRYHNYDEWYLYDEAVMSLLYTVFHKDGGVGTFLPR